MAKGYWLAHGLVHDPVAYEAYRQANAEAFTKYGARFLVRGGQQTVVEGTAKPRAVVIEFDSYEQALACYHSPEYQRAKALRDPVSEVDLAIVEGWDG